MNPMYLIAQSNSGIAKHWWLRHGAGESHISLTAMVNLALSLKTRDQGVNAWFYWDADHIYAP